MINSDAPPGSPDRWTFCRLGHIHWGAHGGAGLLLRHVPRKGEPEYLLTERSRQVDEGGTWSMPGGGIHDGESPQAAAHREAVVGLTGMAEGENLFHAACMPFP